MDKNQLFSSVSDIYSEHNHHYVKEDGYDNLGNSDFILYYEKQLDALCQDCCVDYLFLSYGLVD